MRNSKTIIINDNGNEYKYMLTKMSALQLQKWSVKAFSVLIETGILNQNAVSDDFVTNLQHVFGNFSGDFLQKLATVDSEKLNVVILELIEKTAERLAGASKIKVTENDLNNTLEELGSIFELEKECLFVNFPIFATVGELASPQSEQVQEKPKIIKQSI